MPWYVNAFLKLVNPFIDPVTKANIKPNEPLPDHVPVSQLMTVSGGEVDFKYDHSIYWPALEKITTERRQQRKERWEKGGKMIGESEIYLWGGEEGSLSESKPEVVENGNTEAVENTEGEATVTGQTIKVEETNGTVKRDDVALANDVAKLDVNGDAKPDVNGDEKAKTQGTTVPTAA